MAELPGLESGFGGSCSVESGPCSCETEAEGGGSSRLGCLALRLDTESEECKIEEKDEVSGEGEGGLGVMGSEVVMGLGGNFCFLV